jgi:HD superfamily phosphodiesterase
MNYNDWIPILKEEVKIEYQKAPKELHSSQHQMDHLDRVWERAERIGKKSNADLEALTAIVYLHDIGRQYGLELHGFESAKHAKKVLERIGFPENKRALVLEAIEKHDYQTDPSERKSLESKILYDSDKLDAFGEIGIKRFTQKYLVEKVVEMSIQEIIAAIDRRWETLMLPETKELAKGDYIKIKNHFEAML